MNLTFIENNLWLFILLVLWELIWKGLALWRAAQNKQRTWFVVFLFINTVGVLPIIYLRFFSHKKSERNL